MSKTSDTPGTTGLELLQVAFIVLKLCHVIAWSWWWVLSPFWISAAVALIVCVVWYFS